MDNSTILLHLGNSWSVVDTAAAQLSPIAPYPRLDRPVWVIEDFAQAPAGVTRLQGKPAHAPALIERKVRSEGLVDGESRVLVHAQRKEADGLQLLYTAVPLSEWQQVMAWADVQKNHCLILPLSALVSARVGEGEGRVLRHGRQLVFFAHTNEGFIHAAVTAYSDDFDDLLIAARSLGDQAHRGCHHGKSVHITWCSFAMSNIEEEKRLIVAFRAEDECPVEFCAMEALSVDGQIRQSALPFLMSQCTPGITANPGHEKIAAQAERLLPLTLSLTTVAALGLFALGGFAHWQVRQEAQQLQQQRASIEQKTRQIQDMNALQIPAEYETIRNFVGQLGSQEPAYNPSQVLSTLRTAAAGEIRILRVRLEKPENPLLIHRTSLIIDGALREGSDPTILTQFLMRLRAAGYETSSLDPADGALGGGFTYRLTKTRGAA